MADWSGILKDIAMVIADSKAILGLGAGGLALITTSRAMPRFGLVRAFTLGWGSYFKTTYPLSVRKLEINQLNDSLQIMQRGSYITIIGRKGTGKTCLVDTTLNRQHGVVKFSTKSGADKDLIVDQALRAITGIRYNFINPIGSARRLLFFYSFMFKRSPIVVINVPERDTDEKYAQVTSAVRALTDEFGLRVIVDGSPNALPPQLLATEREKVFAVEPMSKEQIESISECQELISFLKRRNLDGTVWKVFGGSPIDYLNLKEDLEFKKMSLSDTASDEQVEAEVKNWLRSILTNSLNKKVAKSSSITKQIIKIFRDKKIINIPITELEAMGILLDSPNKVFREVKKLDDFYVEPSTPAVSLIISRNIKIKADVFNLLDNLMKESQEEKVQ